MPVAGGATVSARGRRRGGTGGHRHRRGLLGRLASRGDENAGQGRRSEHSRCRRPAFRCGIGAAIVGRRRRGGRDGPHSTERSSKGHGVGHDGVSADGRGAGKRSRRRDNSESPHPVQSSSPPPLQSACPPPVGSVHGARSTDAPPSLGSRVFATPFHHAIHCAPDSSPSDRCDGRPGRAARRPPG